MKLYRDRGRAGLSMAFRLRGCTRFIPGGRFPVGMTVSDIIGELVRRPTYEPLDEVLVDGRSMWPRR